MPRIAKLSVFVLVAAAGCSEPSREPAGEEIWASFGGLCEPACGTRALYRDDMLLEFRRFEDDEVVKVRHGTLTEAGLAEYMAASAAVGPERVLETCSGADGIDARAVAFDGTGTFEVRYCLLGDLDPAVLRLHGFFITAMDGIDACTSHAWFDAC